MGDGSLATIEPSTKHLVMDQLDEPPTQGGKKLTIMA